MNRLARSLSFLQVNPMAEKRVVGPFNFWNLFNTEIPNTPGAYILMSSSKNKFRYPGGWSSVFYIGESKDLERRLRQHRRYTIQCQKAWKGGEDEPRLYWPRYQYAATFGHTFAWIPTWPGLSSKSLEGMVIGDFIDRFHSRPVANGGFTSNKVNFSRPMMRGDGH